MDYLGFIDPMPQVFSEESNYGWARPDIPSTYTVQSGDTLSGIGEQFDVSTEYLARINDIADPDLIISRRELTIKTSDNYWRQRLLDREPLYWNEESPENRPFYTEDGLSQVEEENLEYCKNTYEDWERVSESLLGTSLLFEDQPLNLFLDQDNPETSHFAFKTELVGVTSDGSIRFLVEEFPNAGLCWEWKSNLEADPDTLAAYLGGVFDTGTGAYPVFGDVSEIAIVGGVFDVQNTSTPEPSSLVLAGIGLFGGWLLVKRRRRVALS